MKKAKQPWADDEDRINLIKQHINHASDDEIRDCLTTLQSHEEMLKGRQRSTKKRYIRFSDLLTIVNNLLKADGIITDEEQIDKFLKLLLSEFGGVSTTIPKKSFLLDDCVDQSIFSNKDVKQHTVHLDSDPK